MTPTRDPDRKRALIPPYPTVYGVQPPLPGFFLPTLLRSWDRPRDPSVAGSGSLAPPTQTADTSSSDPSQPDSGQSERKSLPC